jgi:hypothetical protein
MKNGTIEFQSSTLQVYGRQTRSLEQHYNIVKAQVAPSFPRRSRYVHPRPLEAGYFYLAVAFSDALLWIRRAVAHGGQESVPPARVLH